uniref:NERD domain-containing protein n=1 Tax=Myoviridae sp. ctByu2 TaxID=2827668 RepID=A0A8S5SA59_9CAUD|nr:MAG TPA: hypothetical protein [Myoviridae sp. ctByu2]
MRKLISTLILILYSYYILETKLICGEYFNF